VTGGQLLGSRVEADRAISHYSLDRPGKYYTLVGGRIFQVGMRQEGSVLLKAFAVPRTRNIAEGTLSQAAEMIRFFTAEFGPCPYPSVNLVLIEGVTPGGHSPPGMVILQRRPLLLRGALREDPANFSDVDGFFLAHELAHQWWGQGVAPENYRERWLSEGMAQYAAALWARHAYGEDEFQDILKRMARWAVKDNGKGPINLGHRLGHIKGGPEIYRAVVYDKGAYVLHMLRGIAGEDAFRQAITAFQESHRYAKAGTDDLRAALEAATGSDLSAYFREWIFGTTLPSLQFTHRAQVIGEAHRTAIEVNPSNLPGPVPLELTVTHDGGRKSVRVTLLPTGGTFSIDTPAPPRKVEINADRGLLASKS
jgi:aminopeptidase N